MANEQEDLIHLDQLNKNFGERRILNDISLNLGRGEIVGLIGPSGAGKSTMIKVMLGMEKASSGQALVLGKQMPDRHILGELGYMAQADALYDRLTARENLHFFAVMKGIPASEIIYQIDHVAQVVDLSQSLDQRVKNFSGGMKRRLSLAIALLGRPKLLILDEPTVGIDPALRRQIWHELSRLRDKGRGILVTTHVMDEAELTDRVALLLHGQIIAFDPPKKLEADYQVSTIEDVFLKAEQQEENEI
ncbi:ABC transporter ATP-binding protein [Lactobacillus nasalidis]|uniref:ABC transporter ATP-binding protein n=1 Tax=Lactobacillus nasalidis TaxID=2797258 RepID=A0ABQ3W4B1_9LACO|nr:ABC transporter ATP-binding protein [Lactobacillus nasalidis]GHV97548.1 ABC transporter ATP-binding protein [Lactobacillus nasalidis]GHV99270.1 ABC transporter ATP-binding protein [Lactobacillus nasalidis]GHW01351.1 ABC transporter ATP-binding protein [Lactobacillus nasalidis]